MNKMSDLFKVANLSAEQGKKVQSFLKVYNSEIEMPITLINGAKPGKTVIITGGTHGGEYPGIETAIRLASQLNPEEVSGKIAIVHPVNVRAFLAKTQYVGPDDGKNLNRLFPGNATGTFSERIAYTITTELFSQADFFMDLHGGDIHEALVPFVIYSLAGNADVQKISEEASAAMGIKYLVGSMSVTGSFGSAATSGIPGFLAEIGQCGLWSEEEVLMYLKGVKNVLKYLAVLPGKPENLGSAVMVPKMIGSAAEQTGCWYPAVKPGDLVSKGQKLGEIRDYFANILGEYFASQDATVLYVASSLAINIGDPIIAIG